MYNHIKVDILHNATPVNETTISLLSMAVNSSVSVRLHKDWKQDETACPALPKSEENLTPYTHFTY